MFKQTPISIELNYKTSRSLMGHIDSREKRKTNEAKPRIRVE